MTGNDCGQDGERLTHQPPRFEMLLTCQSFLEQRNFTQAQKNLPHGQGLLTYQLSPRRFGTFGRSHKPENGRFEGGRHPQS